MPLGRHIIDHQFFDRNDLYRQVSSDLNRILEQSGTPQQMFEYFTEAFMSIIFDDEMVANGKSVVSLNSSQDPQALFGWALPFASHSDIAGEYLLGLCMLHTFMCAVLVYILQALICEVLRRFPT